ncbi:MAG: DUF2934 domain-containing protein [Gammaproteobacteria bacterium]|nr:DUF2934 domain-containing protein [Gammaproteobacteria bacterium]
MAPKATEIIVSNRVVRTLGQRRSMRASLEQRERMIAEAAYYLAEARGFQGGSPVQDWLDAEATIDRQYFQIPAALRNSLVFL